MERIKKLTNKEIRGFRYRGRDGSKRDIRWDRGDGAEKGLGLRIYPSGEKVFVFMYRFRGRKRLMVLESFGTITVQEARGQAGEKRVLLRRGMDPLEERRRDKQGKTFGDLADTYLEQYSKPHKAPKSHSEDKRRLKQHVPAMWFSRLADHITADGVGALHAEIGATRPYEANRLLSLLAHMFKWGRRRSPSFIGKEAIRDGWENPAVGITRFRERKRKRWVKPEELPALAQAIDQEPNIYVRSAVWLLLMTGLRKTELLAVRRNEIDWSRGVLRLPHTKSGEEQSASLSAPALAIMQATPAIEGNPYLLPGAKKGHHIVNIGLAWGRIRRRAGIEDVRLHDLRRTVGSWMSQAGVDLNKIKDALRHSKITTTLIYARLGEDAAREPMEQHGRAILEAAGRRGPLVVVEGGAGKK